MKELKRIHLLQYGLIALPLAFAGLPIYIHAPDFYAVNFSISLALIGFILLGLRFIDAIQDPLIGALSDKFNHYRSAIVTFGMIMLGGGFWMIFNPLPLLNNQTAILIWMGLSVFICTTGFSIVTINVQALGGIWKVADTNTSRIMGWREGIGLIGLLIGSILPTILLIFYAPQSAYSMLTLIFLPMLALFGGLFLFWMKRASFDKPNKQNPVSFISILKQKPVRHVYIIFLISGIASAIPATLILFFIRDYLQAENYTGLFLLLYFLSGVIGMPLWQYITNKKSAAFGWMISMILACSVFIGAFFLNAGDIIPFGIICILSGIAIGGDLALPPTIIAEFIKVNKHQDATSRYYALSAFISKVALAIATGIALPLLAFYGYQPGTITTDISMPMAYALIPCIIKLTAALILWHYIKNNRMNKKYD